MTGKIIASCGHEVQDLDGLVHVRYGDWDCDPRAGFEPCIVYAVFCRECAADKKHDFLRSSADEAMWLSLDD